MLADFSGLSHQADGCKTIKHVQLRDSPPAHDSLQTFPKNMNGSYRFQSTAVSADVQFEVRIDLRFNHTEEVSNGNSSTSR